MRHVALVTGLKRHLGPFEAYGRGSPPATPFREEQKRLDVEDFHYAQEDELLAASGRDGFGWSVHRPHTIIGYAIGNAMNMGVTLAACATLCRETGRPFAFPGSAVQWNGLTDMTDARLLARHRQRASTNGAAGTRRSTWSTATSSAGIARRHGLVEPDLDRLASAWHTDADLGRPVEVVTDMSRSRKLGFLDYQPTDEAFLDLFERLRAARAIP